MMAVADLVEPHKIVMRVRHANVDVNVSDEAVRAPLHLVLLLDVSGSMTMQCAAQIDGEKVELAYSQLDLVAHAVKVMTRELDAKDCLSVVVFSSTVRVLVANVEGGPDADWTKLMRELSELRASGSTMLGAGMASAYECVTTADKKDHNNVIVCLTDGQPTDMRDHAARIAHRQAMLPPGLDVTLHMIVFGRAPMDPTIMRSMAHTTGGMLLYLDGPEMLATVTGSLLTNLKLETHACLELVCPPGPKGAYPDVPGAVAVTAAGAKVYRLGSLRQGQDRAILIELPRGTTLDDVANMTVRGRRLDVPGLVDEVPLHVTDVLTTGAHSESKDVQRYAVGLDVANRLLATKTAGLRDYFKELATPTGLLDSEHPNLALTLRTQVLPGFAFETFGTWGGKYAPALGSALWHQVCANDRDLALVEFMSPAYTKLSNQHSDVFDKVPLAVPRVVPRYDRPLTVYPGQQGLPSCSSFQGMPKGMSGGPFSAPAPAPAAPRGLQMTTAKALNNPAGGCYHGDCKLQLKSGAVVKVSEVTAGMVLANGAEVEVVLAMRLREWTDFVTIGDLCITPWHPVQDASGEWVFPGSLPRSVAVPISRRGGDMRSFLLTTTTRALPVQLLSGGGLGAVVNTAALGHGLGSCDAVNALAAKHGMKLCTKHLALGHEFWGVGVRTAIYEHDANWTPKGVLRITEVDLGVRPYGSGNLTFDYEWGNDGL